MVLMTEMQLGKMGGLMDDDGNSLWRSWCRTERGRGNEEGGSNSFMEGTSASVGLLLAGDAVTTALR